MEELKCETVVVNIPNAFSLLNIMHILSIFVSRSLDAELSISVAFFRAHSALSLKITVNAHA